jgi:uncharacterized protein YdaU (DUF1376 family)
MHPQNHNGGPPIDSDAKMRWVRVNISDILEGMDGLSWEQRGYYVTALFKMYARMDGLPYEEKAGSSVMRCDVRTYRRLRDHLIGIGKFYTEDGMLKNTRVEREITDFCREVKRRREAALEREKRRRDMSDRQEVPADFQPTSPGLPAEFHEKSSEDPGNFHENGKRKANEINVCTATTVAQPEHNSGGNQKPETRNQKEVREKEIRPARPQGGHDYWSQAMKVDGAYDPDDGVTMNDGVPVLYNGVKAKWLEKFDNDEDLLENTLLAIAPYVQKNSSKGLKVSIESQLASRVAQRKDQDRRYERTVRKNKAEEPRESHAQRVARIVAEAEAEKGYRR